MGTQRWLTGLAAGTFVLIAALATAPLAGVARQDSAPPAQARIGQDEAAAIALDAYPGTEVVGIETEDEDGRLRFEVDLSNGIAVEIDAATGNLIAAAQGDEEEEDEEEGEDEEAEEEDEDEEGGEDDGDEQEYTDTFYLDECEWSSTGGNLFFPLEPGMQNVLQGEEDGETLEVIITVLDETETVGGIETRVVEERESEGGELVEVSRNFFAVCVQTGSVIYFGETVDDYEGGQIVGHGGEWRADEGENRPGLIMPAQPLLGARYFQEIAPGVAMDVTETVAVGVQAEVPAGTFEGCIVQMDSNPLESGAGDEKVYCPGVGIVQDEDLELVSVGPAGAAPGGATPVSS